MNIILNINCSNGLTAPIVNPQTNKSNVLWIMSLIISIFFLVVGGILLFIDLYKNSSKNSSNDQNQVNQDKTLSEQLRLSNTEAVQSYIKGGSSIYLIGSIISFVISFVFLILFIVFLCQNNNSP